MILVTGATSVIGQKLCQLLAENNKAFRAMCRKEEQLEKFRKQGIDAVLGDFENPESLRTAMKGCSSLFLVSAPNENQLECETKAIDVAKEEQIAYIVRVSASDANLRTLVPWAKAHAYIDHHLRASGIAWTILKPTAFMQNFLTMTKPISKGFLPQVGGKGLVGYIDAQDIGIVAYHVLTQDHHKRATYYLNGPEALDMKEIALKISEAISKKVRYIHLPSLAFRILLRTFGASRWLANGLVVQYAEVVAKNHDHDLSEEVYRLTNCQPRSFSDFANEHKDAFLNLKS
ncbi:SDR family oxidoreductase [Mucilaginibacter sp. KACC 22063]|uniref:SDR family oxidoreductase n=1 Tax=Mucilaginibacter sp. KACC 22063 TaxID=3025666 RepID=UPI0023658192|nr:SDR family oxidoreductase [Mucilaginibacter sp. KACC 22063]WDF55748.1 SDR family oxidoreductase [Mucilaginibacter sp. KACC 22063]